MQKKLLLVSRERDSYRKQLDSYEKDLTICMAPSSSAQPGANQIQTQKERIDNLEKVIDGYRDMVTKLENDLQNVEPIMYTGMYVNRLLYSYLSVLFHSSLLKYI